MGKARWMAVGALSAVLAACGGSNDEEATPAPVETQTAPAETTAPETAAEEPVSTPPPAIVEATSLDDVLAHPRRDNDRARDRFRNPKETMEFFGVEPHHVVVEALPGGGWYSRVIYPYVADQGGFIGINYSNDLYRTLFGDERYEQNRERFEGWEDTFAAQIEGMVPGGAGLITGLRFGQVPDAEYANTADRVLYIRALHNLARAGQIETAAQDAFTLLKPGGVLGVVQHRAKPDAPEDYVDGSKGYLKEDFVIAAMESAGFVFDGASQINANPNDPADHEIGVWAMPPANRAGEATADLGESDRMTLRFVKPEVEIDEALIEPESEEGDYAFGTPPGAGDDLGDAAASAAEAVDNAVDDAMDAAEDAIDDAGNAVDAAVDGS